MVRDVDLSGLFCHCVLLKAYSGNAAKSSDRRHGQLEGRTPCYAMHGNLLLTTGLEDVWSAGTEPTSGHAVLVYRGAIVRSSPPTVQAIVIVKSPISRV